VEPHTDRGEWGRGTCRDVRGDRPRRGFMKSMVAAGGAVAIAGPAAFFGYQSFAGKPVKAAIIGTGDEGTVLIGEHNPKFLEFIAVCDIRPSNQERAFEKDPKVS